MSVSMPVSHPTNQISQLCMKFFHSLSQGKVLDLLIPRYVDRDILPFEETEDDDAAAPAITGKPIRLLSPESAERYTKIFIVAAMVAELIAEGRDISQRDVYYQHKKLFASQKECNQTIIETGLLLGLKRHEMRIVPASRGFVAGLLRYKFRADAEWTDCLEDISDGGQVISSTWTSVLEEDLYLDIGESRCLLVIEKDGIFLRLSRDNFPLVQYPCTMITGCGFPPIAVRAIVARIARRFPFLPILGLCDYNCYGLALLLNYKIGSIAKSFEGQGWQTPQFKWIGLRAHHIAELQLDVDIFETLSEYDHKKINCMLKSDYIRTSPALVYELEQMKQGNRKCELENLYARGFGFFSDYLCKLLYTNDYI